MSGPQSAVKKAENSAGKNSSENSLNFPKSLRRAGNKTRPAEKNVLCLLRSAQGVFECFQTMAEKVFKH